MNDMLIFSKYCNIDVISFLKFKANYFTFVPLDSG